MKLLILLLLSALCVGAFAQDGGRSSAWEITKADGTGPTMHLMGSIHLLRDDDHPLPAVFERAYKASDVVVLEVKSTEQEGAELETLQRGMYAGGATIRDDLSVESYRKLRRYLEGTGLPVASLDGFRPWMAAMTISLTEMMKLGGKAELGVDAFFEDRANRDGKMIKGLETQEFQIGIFTKLNKADQEVMLVETIEDMASIERDFPRMLEAWRSGDDGTLDRLLNESMDGLPELKNTLLDKRNHAWVKKLTTFMEDSDRDMMVIVGAGHLVGDNSVVALLQKRGFRAKRVEQGGGDAQKPQPKRFIRI